MKWRYYYLKDGEVKTVDDVIPEVHANTPKISLTALSWGLVKHEINEGLKQFLIKNNFLVRVPVFHDLEGKETEIQNNDYILYVTSNTFYNNLGLRPSQAAEIIISSIKDGFDIVPIAGGLGFGELVPYVLKYVTDHKEEFIGKKKVKIFGFSNVCNAVLLQDLIQYIHIPEIFAIKGRLMNFDIHNIPKPTLDALQILKGCEIDQSRIAVPHNKEAEDLCDKWEKNGPEKLVAYPLNVYSFFRYYTDALWPFNPISGCKYSIQLESTIFYDDVKRTTELFLDFRNFLQDIKERGQELPTMIEVGDFVLSNYMAPACVYEHGSLLSPSKVKEKYGHLDYNNLLEKIAKALEKPSADLTQSEIEKFIDEKINSYYRACLDEITKIAQEFNIPVFLGGKERIGHGYHNLVQPTCSNNLVTVIEQKGNKYCLVTSKIRPIEPEITLESLIELESNVRRDFVPQDYRKIKELKKLEIGLIPLTRSAQIYDAIVNLDKGILDVKIFTILPEDLKPTFFEIPSLDGELASNNVFTYLDIELLAGRLGKFGGIPAASSCDVSPLIFVLREQKDKKCSKENYDKQIILLKKFIDKFVKEHDIKIPIYVIDRPLTEDKDVARDFALEDGRKIFTIEQREEFQRTALNQVLQATKFKLSYSAPKIEEVRQKIFRPYQDLGWQTEKDMLGEFENSTQNLFKQAPNLPAFERRQNKQLLKEAEEFLSLHRAKAAIAPNKTPDSAIKPNSVAQSFLDHFADSFDHSK